MQLTLNFTRVNRKLVIQARVNLLPNNLSWNKNVIIIHRGTLICTYFTLSKTKLVLRHNKPRRSFDYHSFISFFLSLSLTESNRELTDRSSKPLATAVSYFGCSSFCSKSYAARSQTAAT